jgi:putative toxin-antitoxin system antitoxin component (TIGR02293 family)
MTYISFVPCTSTPTECWSADHYSYLARLHYIVTKAHHVLGSTEIAKSWLIKPAIALGHNPPCSLLAEQTGFSAVNELLIRIEYGVYT